jgi:tRNA 2-thiouridine synthesizing protein A
MTETLLDARFLKGPMPVLRAARALRHLGTGARLRVLATDPGTVVDFRDFCRDTGHALVSWSEVKGVFSFTIRSAGAPDARDAPAEPAR